MNLTGNITKKKALTGTLRTGGGGGQSVQELFYCTYGTTTKAEITAAIAANKLPVCIFKDISNEDNWYYLVKENLGSYVFMCMANTGASVFGIECGDNGWVRRGVVRLQTALTFLNSVVPGSQNPVTSAGIYNALGDKANAADVVEADQGTANAGKFMVVGSDGIVTPVAKMEEVTVSTGGAVSQALDAGKIYHFTGALTSLTVTLNAPASGQLAQYHFDFNSESTAATLTMPNTVTMPDSFAVEASKHYEVDILNNYGAVMAWAN